ncbi:MAG TPA: hypothetical protein VEY33_05190 [Gemmatimonadota bacterium]|nr:hypothetical protein [Gemmatimonadota bacterium]
MTNHRMQETHPADSELAAWVDEPESRAAAVEAHVEGCGRCRERLAELALTRAALALDPPIPSEAAFAAQRERILAAIGAVPRTGGGRVVHRIGWLVPLAAAAAIAAIVLVSRTEGPDVTLPVVVDAREAAEDAATGIVPTDVPATEITVVPSEAIDEDLLDAALAAAEPLLPPISVERSMTTEARFADLAEEEQAAVLLELASADFDF